MRAVTLQAQDVVMVTQQDSRGISVADMVQLPGDKVGIVQAIDAKKRTVKVQPLAASRLDVDNAIKGYSEFTGMEPGAVTTAPAQPQGVAFLVGSLDAVCYTTVRDGVTEKYIHRFRKASRPLLASSHDGKSLLILGGGYRFTERGIVDS